MGTILQRVVHHFIGSLISNSEEAPAQIYIHDGTPVAQVENRQRHLGEVKLPELRALQQMPHDVSPYVSYFKHAINLMKESGGIDIRIVIRATVAQIPVDTTFLLGKKLQY